MLISNLKNGNHTTNSKMVSCVWIPNNHGLYTIGDKFIKNKKMSNFLAFFDLNLMNYFEIKPDKFNSTVFGVAESEHEYNW